ncbi:tetratricopeptide repeat protein [Omnitrophica bacterium]|nr:tetratricopeptide repeat protein [Candidatus Omnitrophota bacterium]
MEKHINPRSLSLYLDGRIKPEPRGLIDEHLSTCKGCRDRFLSLKTSIGLLKELPQVSESEHFDFEFKRRLDEELARRGEPRPYYGRIREVLERMPPRVLRPVPVMVKAVSIVTIIAFLMVSIVWDQIGVMPAIASVEGKVEIYSTEDGEWQDAKAGMRVKTGDMIKVGRAGQVNIESKKYEILLKGDTLVRAVDPERVFGKRDSISYGLDRGRMFVATKRGFKGSSLKIDSPSAEIETKSTGFLVKVLPSEEDKTWVGVLDGKVEVRSKFKLAGLPSKVLVGSGKATEVVSGAAPRAPRYQRKEEWEEIQEIYGIGDQPVVALLISMTPRRVHELLRPAGLYISDKKTKSMPKEAIDIAVKINRAITQGDREKHLDAIHSLEGLIDKYPDARYNIQFTFFIATYYYYIDEHKKAISVLESIVNEHPDSNLISLALCAKAIIYERYIKDNAKAAALYKEILTKYPESLEVEESSMGLNRLNIK